MGNISSVSDSSRQNTRSHAFRNLRRTLGRMIQRRRAHAEREEEFEDFERLLRDEFSVNSASDSELNEHLITIHVSHAQHHHEFNIYISVFNHNGEKIAEGTITEDVTQSTTQCFMTFMPPNAQRIFNARFGCPYSARFIRAFILGISRPAEENA